MKRGITGLILFVLSAVIYALWANNSSGFIYDYGYPVSIIFAVAGILIAWFSPIRWMAVTGAMGNVFVLFVTVLFPYKNIYLDKI